jgi:3-methyladenine DNA glycosylase Tag
MQPFAEIYALACERHGGAENLEASLSSPKPTEELLAIPDEQWLAAFTRVVFQAGISWKVIDAKWDGFEKAFHHFDLGRNALISDEELDRLASDTSIVRSPPKIASVRINAAMLLEFAKEHGSASSLFANWPVTDFVGLLDMLKTKGNRLGGNTSAYVLRYMGHNSIVFGRDGVAALARAEVVSKAPSSKRDLAKVQAALNQWMDESGRSLTHISQILAKSIYASR